MILMRLKAYEPMTEEASALVYYRGAEIQQQWLLQHRFYTLKLVKFA